MNKRPSGESHSFLFLLYLFLVLGGRLIILHLSPMHWQFTWVGIEASMSSGEAKGALSEAQGR